MLTVKSTLTIIFEPPFYKAIFERRCESTYEIGQVNLGTSEPKSSLIYALVSKHWSQVHLFSQKVNYSSPVENKVNPKRLQRLARKSTKEGIGTQAQRTLQKQIEQQKRHRKQKSHDKKIIDQNRQFALRTKKRIQKHKGR